MSPEPSSVPTSPPRKFGLNQVYPDPNDTNATAGAKTDIVALHGLDAESPKTWIAWKVDGISDSGDVHWLKDRHMLPDVMPDSRILTYDWNANYDKAASSDTFVGQAETLLDRIYLNRKITERLQRPIIFIASCFSGLLLAKALLRAAEPYYKREEYREILHLTVGVAFLGTPFRGSWNTGYTTAELRIAAAIATGSEHSKELPQYLREGNSHQPSPLDELANRFCEMVKHEAYKFDIICVYETRHTNFSAKLSKLPKGFATKELNADGHGIAVPRQSACLPDAICIGLEVRHNMLHKFNDPKDDGFQRLSSRLKEFAEQADNVLRQKGLLTRTKANIGTGGLLSRVGIKREDFSVVFSLFGIPEIEHFVAREKELAEIHRELGGDGPRRTIVLHGLGGIGKTQLSVAYAKRHMDDYSAIFWLNIRDKDSLEQSFVKVAQQILRDHPSAGRLSSVDMNENLAEVIDAVKAWLSLPANTRWLMIYDNYDNPRVAGNMDFAAVDIRPFLPESYQGSVIITTRSSHIGIGHCLHVRKLENMDDSLKILSNASRRQGLMKDPDAVKLAKELDGLPLALATAGAYLDQTAISLHNYLRLYKESWMRLKQTSPELSSYENRTLYSTWQISFDYIKQRKPLSAKLLCLWAYFDSQDIWFELLRHGDSKDPEWIRELTQDEISFHDTVRILSNYGLVEVATSEQEWIESKGYSIHGCVHSWTVHALNREWDFDLARLAVKFVGAHIPGEGDVRPWLIQCRLLQHAARCLYMVVKHLVADDGMLWAYHQLGLLFAEQGKLAEAESIYERALVGKEKALGVEHTSTLATVGNLGNLYKDQGKLAKAESMYKRALAGYEKAVGAEHASTLDTVGNLGNLYKNQGKLVEAESMYKRALAGKEKALGAEHTSTLATINNLALFYANQGKFAEAGSMYERALAGKEKALGAEHTSTLATVGNLGSLYKDQGKLAKAESMYKRALAGYEKALGTEHTLILKTVGNLGLLYADQGKLAEAELMYERALAGKEKALGAEHTSTLDTVGNLGNLYNSQGKLAEAESMYERALAGYEKAVGTEHTLILKTVGNLGLLYANQGKLAEAESMLERALAGYEKALGAENTITYIPALNIMWALGSLFESQADKPKARIMYAKAFAGYGEIFGPDHPRSQSLRDKLGTLDFIVGDKALGATMLYFHFRRLSGIFYVILFTLLAVFIGCRVSG